MGGGGGTPQQRETAQERQLAQQAQSRWNERRDDGYLDLERQAISEADRDYTSLLEGRASADVALAEREAYRSVAGANPTASRLGEIGVAVGQSLGDSMNDANIGAKRISDAAKIAVVKRGNDVATDSSTALSAGARLASQRATNRLQNEIIRNNARQQAVTQVLGAGIQGHALKKSGYTFGSGGITGPAGSDGSAGKEYGYTPFLGAL